MITVQYKSTIMHIDSYSLLRTCVLVQCLFTIQDGLVVNYIIDDGTPLELLMKTYCQKKEHHRKNVTFTYLGSRDTNRACRLSMKDGDTIVIQINEVTQK